MSDVDQDSKTELATEKHLSEALEKGQFAKSPEISVVAMLTATLAALSLTLGSAAHDVGSLAVNIFSQLGTMQVAANTAPSQLGDILLVIGKVLLPIIGASVLASLISGGLQSGFVSRPKCSASVSKISIRLPGFPNIFQRLYWCMPGWIC
jgi:flagellar biosynthetic protein FlhB